MVKQRPRATLGRIIEDLGATLIEVVAGRVRPDVPIGGLAFHDPADPPALPEDAFVLAVGVASSAEITNLVHEVSGSARGVLVRLPVDVGPDLQQAVGDTGVVVLGLTRGASWAHVASLLRSMLAFDDSLGAREMLAGAQTGDLFALANAVSALLDAPITIEDLNSTVLAFSADQDRADESRKEGILGRRVPERYTRELTERGIFRQVYSSHEPVFIQAFHSGDLSRAAVRIAAGDEVLGSLWAAVEGALSAERRKALAESATVVALQMLRLRAGADVERRLHADLLATVLEGGLRSKQASERLSIAGPACVLAVGLALDSDALDVERRMQRARGALSLHLSAIEPRSAAAMVDGVLYAVVRVNDATDEAELRIVGVAREFLERVGDAQELLVGVGGVATDASELPRARNEARWALRVLVSGQAPGRTVRARDVGPESLMLGLVDLAGDRGWIASKALTVLIEHDRRRGSSMVDTLQSWLEEFGDVGAASQRLHVHTNTFRYRLRRVRELSGLDLDDADTRFALLLELRLLHFLRH